MNTVHSITHKVIRSSRGLAFTDMGIIHIDSRLKGAEHLYILCHEIIHCQNPKWPEAKVIGHAEEMARLLYGQGYRKVDL